jgi:hypothetical protein
MNIYNTRVDNDPLLSDKSEPESSSDFPWAGMIAAILLFFLAAAWIIYSKTHDGSGAVALEAELVRDKAVLKEERDKVFEITQELDILKQAISLRQVPDVQKAKTEYNQLAAQQRAQRDKVKTLIEQYNAKVAKLRELE